MGSTSPDDSFCLKWNDFHTSVTSSFADLRRESDLFDITLVCEGGRNLQAHRLILSACSLVFKRLLKSAKHAKEPTILLWDVKASDMEALLNFMYNGEVNVTHAELNTFLDVAEKLKVRGLTNDCEKEKKPNQLRRKNTTNANSVNSTPTKKAKVVVPAGKALKASRNSMSASEDNVSFDGESSNAEGGDTTPGIDTAAMASGATPGGGSANDDDDEEEDEEANNSLAVNPLPPPPPHMLAGATGIIVDGGGGVAVAAPIGAGGQIIGESPAMSSVNTAEPVFGPDGSKGYACPYCEKIYLTKSRVKRHILDVHETGEYPCPDCGKMFTSARRLKDHNRSQYCKGKQQQQQQQQQLQVNANFLNR